MLANFIGNSCRVIGGAALALTTIGCGGSAAVEPIPADQQLVMEESEEVDAIIAKVEQAISGDVDASGMGLYLQENMTGLQETYPEKADVLNELQQIAARLEAAPNNTGLLNDAKEKLEQLK